MKKLVLSFAVLMFAAPVFAQSWNNDFDQNQGGFGQNGDYNDGYHGGGYNDGYGGGYDPNPPPPPPEQFDYLYLTCASPNQSYQECIFNGRDRDVLKVEVEAQHSRAACHEGSTWGYNRGVLWVNSGCRANFKFTLRKRGGYNSPGNGYRQESVRCESVNGQHTRCATRGWISYAEVSRQLSKSACTQGVDWSWDRDTLWVANGCRAIFTVSH